MNKSIWLFCILLFIPSILIAQGITVQSFVLAEKDFTANTQGTMVLDYNGDACALIKVETNEKDFVFDGGLLGIISVVEQSDEIWVYVPSGIKRISINHPQLGKLRDYYFPIFLEKGKTYKMKIANSTAVSDDSMTDEEFNLLGGLLGTWKTATVELVFDGEVVTSMSTQEAGVDMKFVFKQNGVAYGEIVGEIDGGIESSNLTYEVSGTRLIIKDESGESLDLTYSNGKLYIMKKVDGMDTRINFKKQQ